MAQSRVLRGLGVLVVVLLLGPAIFFINGREYFFQFREERIAFGFNLGLSFVLGTGLTFLLLSLIRLVRQEFAYRRQRIDEHHFWNNVGSVLFCLMISGGSFVGLVQESEKLRTEVSQSSSPKTSERITSIEIGCEPTKTIFERGRSLKEGVIYASRFCEGLAESKFERRYDDIYVVFDPREAVTNKVLPLVSASVGAIPLLLLIRAVRDLLRATAKVANSITQNRETTTQAEDS